MIDTHVHLDDRKFEGKAEEIISKFESDNIDFVINNSCDKPTMLAGLKLAKTHERVFCTVGMHPHDAKKYNDEFENLMQKFAVEPKVLAVGEIGLDYYRDLSDRKTQRDVFARQIEISDKFKLPVVLHVRDAYGDAVDVLIAQKKYLNSGVLWHCFNGSAELARQMARHGHFFAFGGAVTFKNARKESVIENVPIEQILSETDCPYMTPEPFRGQVNFPKYVRYVVEKLAWVYDISFEKMQQQIAENCKVLFPKLKAID